MRKLFIIIVMLFALTSIISHIYGQSITNEDDTSWYKCQLGIDSNQSGATCIAMVIERSGPATSIEQVKNQLPDNSVKFDDLLEVLNHYDIYHNWLTGLSEWNGDGILMIAINPKYVEAPYSYSGRHYIIITGETDTHYIVNDPMVGRANIYYSKEAVQEARFNYIIWIP